MQRRDLMIIGGAVAVAVAIPPLLRLFPSDFEFEPLPGFDGFRLLRAGDMSASVNPLIGLSEPEADQTLPSPEPITDPCLALFGSPDKRVGALPVAFFTDINCPYCKVLEQQLIELRDREGIIDLTWHELPLLRPSSVQAARAILAARTLNAEPAARTYLATQPLPPGPAGLTRLAEAIDLAPEDLIAAESSVRVSQLLNEDLSLGRRLGLFGTPGTVVGRTLVIGAMRSADLTKLIALELSEQGAVCI